MNRVKAAGALIWVASGLWAMAVAAGQGPASDRAAVRQHTESLAAELLPKVAELNGFREYGPVKIEPMTKAELRETFIPTLKEYYGTDGLRRQSRVLAALGLLPPDYDLEAGMADLLIELMGGGYDPLRSTFYTILDLPPAAKQPAREKIVVAHELTHALQDQAGDMVAQLRRAVSDWDYAYLYNCVIEGMAWVTCMAVSQGVPLAEAPDAAALLRATQSAFDQQPGLVAYARSPRFLRELLFGRSIQGVDFCRALLQDRPDFAMATLLDSLPASGEQILHYDKYVAGDRPAGIDLSLLVGELPASWRPQDEYTLGESEMRILFETHEATRLSAAALAAGWDGCRLRAFGDDEGRLAILGLSVWDSEEDAREFAAGFSNVLAEANDPPTTVVEADGQRVRFVIGLADAPSRQVALNALAAVRVSN